MSSINQPEIDNLLKIHEGVRAFDLHYSTARIAIATFAVSLGVGFASLVVKDIKPVDVQSVILAFGPEVFFIMALAIGRHFQSLTYACRIMEQELEERLHQARTGGGPPPDGLEPTLFRIRLERLFTGQRFVPIPPAQQRVKALWLADNPQWLIFTLAVIYVVFWLRFYALA